MPATVRKSGRGWAIVEMAGGRVTGRSTTRGKAIASARAQNAAHRKKKR